MNNKNTIPALLLLSSLGMGFLGGVLGVLLSKSTLAIQAKDGILEDLSIPLQIQEEENATISSVTKAMPSVVSIVVSKDRALLYRGAGMEDLFFGFPFGSSPYRGGNPIVPENVANNEDTAGESIREQVGGGTGFIISADGMILTNKHVVSLEAAEYTVVTQDGKEYPATVLGKDPFNDFAIVKITAPESLPVLELGDSDQIRIGQTAIAIGYSLGQFKDTVTKGIVSAINRRVVAGDGLGASEVIEEAIQTDAAINPGNSGGPLLDIAGRVIGINTAVSQSGQLIGFAIPINSAKAVIDNVKKFGRLVRPFLGVRYILIDESIAEERKLSRDHGALIARSERKNDPTILPGSPAEKAGLAEGDIILEVDGTEVDQKNSLPELISRKLPGDTVSLKVLREEKEITKPVVLEEFVAKL
ncbi:MAG: protease [Parcubacteria group bacterium Gr01-1014_18]|nr:MAG: protease [Parcubacteria group bacterium Greene0416_36]TSC81296.1 MAG: protease [Parcubacteria group bacterium Gr01-1014_18]TSC99318.1 MAG: protease [Parcubacteria group bacterium Greene1014_20]TSD06845.1 MAG: protease [Parcubacteria group bacterium Greene0714_2]